MLNKKSKFRKKRKGFTLVELLVAIAVIGVLATLAATAVSYARKQAKIAKAQNEANEIYKAMTTMGNDTGAWPGNQAIDTVNATNGNEICGDGCAFGLAAPEAGLQATDGNYANWSGPYMVEVPLDPWGNQYFFDTDYSVTAENLPCDGGGGCVDAAVVGSYGPDGLARDQYNGDDVIRMLIK